MEQIKVVIGEMPRLLSDILQTVLSNEPDIGVIVKEPDGRSLPDFIGQTKPNIVLVACDESEISTIGMEIVQEHLSSRVLAVMNSGQMACLYELRPSIEPLGEISPEKLLAVIRKGCPSR